VAKHNKSHLLQRRPAVMSAVVSTAYASISTAIDCSRL
jgi:hypothetical protein